MANKIGMKIRAIIWLGDEDVQRFIKLTLRKVRISSTGS